MHLYAAQIGGYTKERFFLPSAWQLEGNFTLFAGLERCQQVVSGNGVLHFFDRKFAYGPQKVEIGSVLPNRRRHIGSKPERLACYVFLDRASSSQLRRFIGGERWPLDH